MSGKPAKSGSIAVSRRLEKAITELRGIQRLLLSGEGLDERILTDFRDAVSRVRNTAWSAQQYIALKGTDQDPSSVLAVLAAERIRAAFQLCQAIQADLKNADIKFQPGHLGELHLAVKGLFDELSQAVGKSRLGPT